MTPKELAAVLRAEADVHEEMADLFAGHDTVTAGLTESHRQVHLAIQCALTVSYQGLADSLEAMA